MKSTEKGITLVALVITIIILLILAGIAISQLTQTSLFENAKIAKSEYENAKELENSILSQYENSIKSEGTISSSREAKVIKITGTTPSRSDWWEKAADYPTGCNKSNVCVKLFRIIDGDNYEIPFSSYHFQLKDDGIYMAAKNRFSATIDIWLEVIE